MPQDPKVSSLLATMSREFRAAWKSLVLTDIAFKIIAFVVLTPLTSLLLRAMLAVAGNAVLTDAEIAFFLVGPWGWVCFVVIGAVWLGIVALEQASLTAILAAREAGESLTAIGALRFAALNAATVLCVTARIVGLTLLAAIPFLAVAGGVYLALLTEYDINFYLKESPPKFLAAVAIGGVLAAGLAALLLHLFSGWFFALPLVLFEGVSPREALRESGRRAEGHRLRIVLWIAGWFVATTVLAVVASMAVGFFGRLIIPTEPGSLRMLAFRVGAALTVWAIVSLAINLLSSTTFSVILFRLYRRFGCDRKMVIANLEGRTKSAAVGRLRITPLRLLIAGVVGVLIAVGVGAAAIRSVRIDNDVEIMAHRGASRAAPENTLAAIKQAIQDGADWVEIDVQESADGEVVVFHDSDFMKVAGRKLKIWEATRDDLREIDIGGWFAPEFRGERVPALAEVLDECRGKIGVNIELKYYGHDQQLEQRVAEIVASRNMDSEVKAMSLKIDGVKKMKSLRPEWEVGLLMSVAAGNIKQIEADFLAVNASFANRSLFRKAHESGKQVYVWTVNDPAAMSAMIGRGADGLLTDEPAVARSVLEQRAEMSVPERLLLEIASWLR